MNISRLESICALEFAQCAVVDGTRDFSTLFRSRGVSTGENIGKWIGQIFRSTGTMARVNGDTITYLGQCVPLRDFMRGVCAKFGALMAVAAA